MENKILKFNIQGREILVQMLIMDKSIYLNIGESKLTLKSMLLAMPSKYESIPSIQKIIPLADKPDWHTHQLETFHKSLSKKLNLVIYASIDLDFKEDLDAMAVFMDLKEKIIESAK